MPGARRAGLDPDALTAEVATRLSALPHGAVALVALSGGPDSAGLALLVSRARPDLELHTVHVRHGLRDDAADAEAAAAIAATLDLPFTAVAVTVRTEGEGLEAAARRARLAALAEAAEGVGALAVLVGHTADDQAETIVLALGRGTGIRGLSGMRPERAEGAVTFVRPMLRLRRADVRAAAAAAGLRPVEDPTNADPHQRRRRVRTEVLPALARLSGDTGDPVALLTRLADLARDDADLLDRLAAEEARRLIHRWGTVRLLRAEHLAALPRALARRVVRTALADVRGRLEGLDAGAVERVLELPVGGAVTVSGGTLVTANGGWLAVAPGDLADLPTRALPVPGSTELPELGLRILAEVGPHAGPAVAVPLPPRSHLPHGPAAASAVTVAVTSAASAPELVVRARQPGDRAPGSATKLGDRLTTLGVPRALRCLVPVVAHADGTPLWVPGVAVAAGGGGTPVHLRLEPLEAAGAPDARRGDGGARGEAPVLHYASVADVGEAAGGADAGAGTDTGTVTGAREAGSGAGAEPG